MLAENEGCAASIVQESSIFSMFVKHARKFIPIIYLAPFDYYEEWKHAKEVKYYVKGSRCH